MTTKQPNGHGGKREGAGRKAKSGSDRAVRADTAVNRKMKQLAEQGWDVLAESYPNLMSRAIEVAVGNDTKMPNVAMLRTLLELMVKVTGTEVEVEDTQLSKMVGRFLDRVQETRTTNGRAVDERSRGSVLGTDGTDPIRFEADITLS